MRRILVRAVSGFYLRRARRRGLLRFSGDGYYGRFATMLCNLGELDGRRIVERATLEMMFSRQIVMQDGRHFGLGFVIENVTIGDEASGEAVATEQYGWGGYANTEFKVLPDLGLCMVFMRQTVPTTHPYPESCLA